MRLVCQTLILGTCEGPERIGPAGAGQRSLTNVGGAM